MELAIRELGEAKVCYDTLIAPKSRDLAKLKKDVKITNRKKDSAQIRVNQTTTKITDVTKQIKVKRMDVHAITSRNDVMASRLRDKEMMMNTLRSAIAERDHSSCILV